MSPEQFRLSSTLAGHGADVRSLASSPSGPVLFSSSRDGTARSWVQGAMAQDGKAGGNWTEGVTYQGQHEGFVNAVEWISGHGEGYLATAGQDSLIHIWPLSTDSATSTPTPSHTLIGHSSNVCSLNASKDGKWLVSGSWDKTAKIWRTSDWQLAHTLEGHEQAVWAVLALEDDELVLTGAADNQIRLWHKGKLQFTFKGHTQAVRALTKLDASIGDGSLFASAGNDGSIRLWSLATKEAVHVLNGHDSFIYSLSPISAENGGGLISGGEDRTMRVWRAADGECEQTIVIPAISVWTVAALSNGDIAAGSSDGIVRVFSRRGERWADAETLAKYEQDVSSTALNPSQVGDVKKNDLPGAEALDRDGTKEGQVKMINSGGNVEAYQWSSSSQTWVKIGQVVDAVGNSRKQLYNGEEYDYVFDVDFSDGAQPLKLPYNVTQNPYEVAQKFLFAHELPQAYIDDVVKHIENNTNGVALGTGMETQYVDPYTGASRYTSGGGSGASASRSAGFSGDPFTGGGASAAPSGPRLLPHKSMLAFTQANLAALLTKLGQLNDQFETTSDLKLSTGELDSLDSLVSLLLVGTSSPGKSSPTLGAKESAVALKLLRWPPAQVFPGLDIARLVFLSNPLPEVLPSLLEVVQSTAGTPKEVETNSMLALRALANAFSCASGRALMSDEVVEIGDTLRRRGFVGINKNGKVAMATIVLNYSVLAVQKALSVSASPLLDLLVELLRDSDAEVVYRSLVALGNFLLSPQVTSDVPAAGLQRYKMLAKETVKRIPEARIKAILAELL